jgi:hypothetical protein
MAHYAKLDENNIVLEVNVVDNSVEDEKGEAGVISWLIEGWGGTTWVKTSYNTHAGVHINDGTPLRKNYAQPSDIYDAGRDAFYTSQPFPSWTLNETTCRWEAGTTYPDDEKIYAWDEDTTSWVEVSE